MTLHITEGQVWRATRAFRRVTAVLVTTGRGIYLHRPHVFYSRGGNADGACLRTTFLRWIQDNKAKLSRGAHAKKRKRDELGRFV